MDVYMPRMDGRIAAQTIKSMSPDLPIVTLLHVNYQIW